MEIFNYGSWEAGYPDYVPHVYDEFLRSGKRIYAIATDDNHSGHPVDAPQSHSFGGYVWIKAESLTYENIWNALRFGDFYACTGGPEIASLTLEDDVVTLKCAPARRIAMQNATRDMPTVCGTADAPVTELTCRLKGNERYIRFTVTGFDGHRSQTRAYFLDELGL
jgi:hypothetical protein